MPVTNYVWDPLSDNVLLETDENDVTQAVYTQEPDAFGNLISQRRNDETSYYHFDGLGSTRELTSETETVTDTNMYDAWGVNVASTGTTGNPFHWVGELGYYDDPETGGYYVRARTYRPTIARWTSVDPLDIAYVAMFNQYWYTYNLPVVDFDPSGADPRPPIVVPVDPPADPSLPPIYPPSPGDFDFGEPVPTPCCKIDGDFNGYGNFATGGPCQLLRQNRRGKTIFKYASAEFGYQIRFSNVGNAQCSCCEYRQFVSGYHRLEFKQRPNSAWQVLTVPNANNPGAPPRRIEKIIPELAEDCAPFGQPNCRRAGHRNEPEGNRRNDRYGPDLQSPRLTSCEYHVRDSPGIFLPQLAADFMDRQHYAALRIDADLRFILMIVDVCSSPPSLVHSIIRDATCTSMFVR